MPADVTAWVLLGALFHACWNALLKGSRARLFDIVGMNVAAAVMAVVALPLLPPVHAACVPWLLTSMVLQVIYFAGVAQAYRLGDLSQAYTIMRGFAPLLVALTGIAVLDERLSPAGLAGIVCIASGIMLPALIGANGVARPGKGTIAALSTAVVIAAYTLVDGMGARLSGSPVTYGLWLFLLHAIPIAAYGLFRDARGLVAHARAHWARGAGCGVLMVGSYVIALWAMTRAPVAAVAALRETSVVFAAIIGAVVLKERFGGWRVAGAALVAAGVVALRW